MTRQRVSGEIIPVSAEHSKAKGGNEEKFAAAHAIDLDPETRSYTEAGSGDKPWLKIKLGKVYCVKTVIWQIANGEVHQNRTCSQSGCANCVGRSNSCHITSLIVSTEEVATGDLPAVSDCKYGDTVKLTGDKGRTHKFYVHEMLIIEKQGNCLITETSWQGIFKLAC